MIKENDPGYKWFQLVFSTASTHRDPPRCVGGIVWGNRKSGNLCPGKGTLALKEEELRKAVEKRRFRTVVHMEALAELDTTKAVLKEGHVNCAAPEDPENAA